MKKHPKELIVVMISSVIVFTMNKINSETFCFCAVCAVEVLLRATLV